MRGRRVYVDENNNLFLAEGDYGKGSDGNWYARPPGATTGSLAKHEVTEYEDGAITVTPSILITYQNDEMGQKQWHGYLIHGIWEEC